jgi:hypothetical protein
MTATLAQTIALLTLSRGDRHIVHPTTRSVLLRVRWIAPTRKRAPGEVRERTYVITDAGVRALGASPHLGQAERELDRSAARRAA